MTDTAQAKKSGRAFWDANPCGGEWPSYEAFRRWIRTAEPYAFELLNSEDWSGARVLEVGCGQGTLLNYLPGQGAASVVGLDASLTSIRRARNGARSLGLQDVGFVHGDAEKLPMPEQSFDMVLSIGVLHHTPETAGAVEELYRVLRPRGRAVVMLYRSGNPKWWATKSLRGASRLIDRFTGTEAYLATRLQSSRETANPAGTALLELFGCPTLKAFSNRQVRAMFGSFESVNIENVQPGFDRLADVLPPLRKARPLLNWIDRITKNRWGFYQVIRANKSA